MCAREALSAFSVVHLRCAPCLFAACVRVQAGEEGDINDGKIEEMMKIIELQISDETKNAVGMWGACTRAVEQQMLRALAFWGF